MLDCLHNIPPYNDRLYACEGPGATLTPQDCLNAVSSSRSCYWDGYEQRWIPCSSICNGALIIGPRGARCRAYCDGINKLWYSYISQWFTCVTRYCSNPEFSLLHLSLAERLCCKRNMNTRDWYVSECYYCPFTEWLAQFIKSLLKGVHSPYCNAGVSWWCGVSFQKTGGHCASELCQQKANRKLPKHLQETPWCQPLIQLANIDLPLHHPSTHWNWVTKGLIQHFGLQTKLSTWVVS